MNAHFFNQCVNINTHATPSSSSELPYGVYLSKVNNRLETIQETNSDFYESKRLAESNIGPIFRSRSSFVNDERNAFFITDNDNNNNNKHKGNSMLQNSNFIFKQSANYNGNILIIDAPPIISINQCKSLKQHNINHLGGLGNLNWCWFIHIYIHVINIYTTNTNINWVSYVMLS